jgi:hypothetical protein
MSVLDQLRSLEQQVLERLRELRPLVAEYRDLEKVAERLGLKREDDEPSGAGVSAAPQAPKREPATKPRAKRAARRPKQAAARKPRPAAATKPKPKPKSAASKPKPKTPAESSTSAVASAAKPVPAHGRRANAKPSARKRSAAAPGQRERDVLRLVGERPGVSVRELASALGVDATGLYGVVRRLQGRGQLTKDGTQLRLPEAPRVSSEPPAPAVSPGSDAGSAEQSDTATGQPPAAES